MNNAEREGRAHELAIELMNILEENLPKDPALTDEAMTRAVEIKKEIQAMGFPVEWIAKVDPEDLSRVDVEIILYKKKEGLSPEDQEHYNDWYLRANGIEPPH